LLCIGEPFRWAKRLGQAKIIRDWLDRNCKSITLTVEQLAKASYTTGYAKVYWPKGSPNLSEFLFNPSFLLEGDSENLDVFMSSIPLREKKPSAFTVKIAIGEAVYAGKSNYFSDSWALQCCGRSGAITCSLSDGVKSQIVESVYYHENLTFEKALAIMRYFDNWAHYELSQTLVKVVEELNSTKSLVAKSPEIRDLKEAIKKHLLSRSYLHEIFLDILRNIQKKSEVADV
jgi:hypothetical protein